MRICDTLYTHRAHTGFIAPPAPFASGIEDRVKETVYYTKCSAITFITLSQRKFDIELYELLLLSNIYIDVASMYK